LKIKIGHKNKEYCFGLYRGNGGISSLIECRHGSFLYCIRVFTLKNIRRALK